MSASSSATAAAQSKSTNNKGAVNQQPAKMSAKMEQIDDDDEFEEFEEDDWNGNENINEEGKWRDDWDDEVIDDAFITRLREELTRSSSNNATASAKS